jgi:O-antigen ligase
VLVAVGLLASAVLDMQPTYVVGGVSALLVTAATYRWLTRWDVMVRAILLTIMFVPIGRYGLPVTLPFSLEPYRLLVAVVAIVWLASLLAESDTVKIPRTALRGPVLAILTVIALSIAVNLGNIQSRGIGTIVVMKVTFFLSFLIVLTVLASLIRTRRDLDLAVKTLVGAAAVVAFFTLFENRTGFNVFDHLHQVMPALRFDGGVGEGLQARGSGHRVIASAQHPLALGAALVTVLPLGLYVGFSTRNRWWWAAVALIGIAALATVARTAVMMLVVELIVLAALKPRIVKRIWWAIPPFLVVVNIAVPATIGTLKASFFPSTLIAEQSTMVGGAPSNRLSRLGPALEEGKRTPFLGQGWGTRDPAHLDPSKTIVILDNQWLLLYLEAGLFGVLAFAWFFIRNFRLLAGAAQRDPTDHGWLLAGLAASMFGFPIGMFTYDAFGFPQATLLMFIMAGLGVSARRLSTASKDQASR